MWTLWSVSENESSAPEKEKQPVDVVSGGQTCLLNKTALFSFRLSDSNTFLSFKRQILRVSLRPPPPREVFLLSGTIS